MYRAALRVGADGNECQPAQQHFYKIAQKGSGQADSFFIVAVPAGAQSCNGLADGAGKGSTNRFINSPDTKKQYDAQPVRRIRHTIQQPACGKHQKYNNNRIGKNRLCAFGERRVGGFHGDCFNEYILKQVKRQNEKQHAIILLLVW